MKNLLKLLLLLLSVSLTTTAQVTKLQTKASIDSLIPTNTTKVLTAARLREAFSKALNFSDPSNVPNLGIPLSKIGQSGATTNQVPSWNGSSWVPTTISTTGNVTGLVTVTNVAALRSRTGTLSGEIIQTSGYTTPNDGGGWAYVWNSTSTTADNGANIIAPTGVSTGRWEYVYYGFVHAKHFGVKGDGVTDDLPALNKCASYMLMRGGKLYIGNTGIIKISDTWNLGTASPSSLPSAENFTIVGDAPTFNWLATETQYTNGTLIRLSGTGKTAIINLRAGLGRYFRMENFTVSCETNGGATNGIFWSTTAFSAHSMHRVHSYRANRAFAVETGGYANGEFVHAVDCVGSGVQNFVNIASNAGQAFNWEMDNCHGSVTGDGGAIFELGGGGLGFGMTLKNFNSSNTILSNFSTGNGVTFLRNYGISGIFSLTGGRIEQVSTVIENIQGTNNINGTITIKGVHFDGLQSNATRKLVKTSANNSAQSVQFEDCIFSPLAAQVANTEVNIDLGGYSESEYRFDRCSFSDFQKYDITHTQTTKGRIVFDVCKRKNTNTNGAIIFSKVYAYNESTITSAVYKSQNYLLQSGFNSSSTGADVVATSPWIHTTQAAFYEMYNKDNALGPQQSTDTRYRQFALKANASVSQSVSTLSFGAGENVFRYRAYLSFYQAANAQFRVRLKNSSTGKIYDSVTLIAPGSDGDFMQVDLLAHDGNVGGVLVVELTNLDANQPTRVNLYGQYVYVNPIATFVETTTTAVNSPIIVR